MAKKKERKGLYNAKKIKNTHKNIKLNIINVFNNNPKCLECNNYMAVHSDRETCSHCNSSIKKIIGILLFLEYYFQQWIHKFPYYF